MTIRHPFEWLSFSGQKRAFVVFLGLTFIVMASLNALDSPLKTDVAPLGIVSFELAGNIVRAQAIVESWGENGQVYAGLSLGLDYLFLVVYAITFALGCTLVAQTLPREGKFFSTGVFLAWVQFGAALLDAVENYGLIRMLLGTQQAWWAVVARWCAIPKFSILGVGLVYIIVGGIVSLWTREKSEETPI